MCYRFELGAWNLDVLEAIGGWSIVLFEEICGFVLPSLLNSSPASWRMAPSKTVSLSSICCLCLAGILSAWSPNRVDYICVLL